MNHSLQLHKKLYSTYKKKGLTENRREIVYNFTNGRTDNSSDLNTNEIVQLISSLTENSSSENLKYQISSRTVNKLFSLCYTYGWKKYDEQKKKDTVDIERLNAWLFKYGKYHKALNDHSPYELGIVTAQFEKIVNQLLKSL
ncbi:hypothetical protein [Chryseobacterium carnipullorum]|uniref:hypothetical protein n=1 Tax=Chryseobacterium carnipullorum TaxID=1124835 RepID=UPI000E89E360|nr:hypothetical protein [Chryseobacterium carnipullorum]HBV14945.1 hypothetical protein [Chryseobacterium carnipullorum]